VNDHTFNQFCDLIYQKSGIHLTEKKRALVENRLGKRIRALGLDSHDAYYRLIQKDTSGDELVQLLDAISTNVTHFFREQHHFDFIQRDIMRRMEQGQKSFTFWSAACSSGEEPYSLAITCAETLQGSCEARILATDISTRILRIGREGRYEKKKTDTISPQLRMRYFTISKTPQGEFAHVSKSLRTMVTFARLNLSQAPYPMHGPFDAVFLRNVMIYFNDEMRMKVLMEIARLLKPDGHLCVGHSESLSSLTNAPFMRKENAVYIKKETPVAKESAPASDTACCR
jgi:chemotaxis protein methyltransferase CheR